MEVKSEILLGSILREVRTPLLSRDLVCSQELATSVYIKSKANAVFLTVLDTICPVDFRESGQIDSDTLHQHLVSRMPPQSTLFVILDCCHSGSALELPYIYKSDDDGNVSMFDNLRQGVHLMTEASDLMMGGFSFNKLAEAQDLYAGATSFFRSFKHMGEQQAPGLGADEDNAMYEQEHKMVTMFSGCRDDQTSADANEGGMSQGAMSWAFLETMKRIQNPTYLQASY
jgi:hypothetical protein